MLHGLYDSHMGRRQSHGTDIADDLPLSLILSHGWFHFKLQT